MLILAKAMLAMMIGFITSVIFGAILIPILKRIKVKQKVSIYLEKTHKSKDGTPTMGGLIFIVPTIISAIILLLMGKMNFGENIFIVLFVFIAYALIGFLDDYLIIKRKNNTINKFSENSILFRHNIHITVIIVGIINISPPIVGVPSFCECDSAKNTLTLCFIFIFFKIGININPNITVVINPIIIANIAFAKINILSPCFYFFFY